MIVFEFALQEDFAGGGAKSSELGHRRKDCQHEHEHGRWPVAQDGRAACIARRFSISPYPVGSRSPSGQEIQCPDEQ